MTFTIRADDPRFLSHPRQESAIEILPHLDFRLASKLNYYYCNVIQCDSTYA
jgi:hypothetical protein